ncbi:hypothetical protein BDP81DRAFT_398315 [Colletotrichum phormii]|uniref:Uncharacterized protein n=1 Tax=Colletotrichum phormii TaxID=359342 RepID=A0AAI9ZHH4_9PEZI|nr:uncharacterized protein BDP81DRAFT_398315 [Colletotrichum phormii]KAK1624679.1 hypothetical protein BDP81DRAFT_398315 [Colletotrichum phormii]
MEDWLEDTVLDALEQVAAGTNQSMINVLVAVQGVVDDYDYGDSLNTNTAVADIGSYARGWNQLSANSLAILPAPTATGLTGHNANTNGVVSHQVPVSQAISATPASRYHQQLHGNGHLVSVTGANNPAMAPFNGQLPLNTGNGTPSRLRNTDISPQVIHSQIAQVNAELAQARQVEMGSAIDQASGSTAGGSAPIRGCSRRFKHKSSRTRHCKKDHSASN